MSPSGSRIDEGLFCLPETCWMCVSKVKLVRGELAFAAESHAARDELVI
jgi:hypothetical protein